MTDELPKDSPSDPEAETLESQPEPTRGEDDPETTYMFARVYLALGEQEEALNWLAKTIAFAGEEHEHIDTYREKLEEVTAKMKEPIDQ